MYSRYRAWNRTVVLHGHPGGEWRDVAASKRMGGRFRVGAAVHGGRVVMGTRRGKEKGSKKRAPTEALDPSLGARLEMDRRVWDAPSSSHLTPYSARSYEGSASGLLQFRHSWTRL